MSWNKGLTKETDPRLREIGRKISASKKGRGKGERRSEWATWKCKNPRCNTLLESPPSLAGHKRYCSIVCRKKHKAHLKAERQLDTVTSFCEECAVEVISQRQPCGKLVPRKLCDDCFLQMRRQHAKLATKAWQNKFHTNEDFRDAVIQQLAENARRLSENGPSDAWFQSMRNVKYEESTWIEDEVESVLDSLGVEYLSQHPISNMIVDFYIPTLNLVIECFGDYWHCNPDLYGEDYYHTLTKRTAGEQWNKDLRRRMYLESEGFDVFIVWESDIRHCLHLTLIEEVVESSSQEYLIE